MVICFLCGKSYADVQKLTVTSQVKCTWHAEGTNLPLYPYRDTLLNQWSEVACGGINYHYSCIDESVANDDDYLDEYTITQKEIYRISDYANKYTSLPVSPDTIKNVDVIWRIADLMGDGAGTGQAGVRVGDNYTWADAKTAYASWNTWPETLLACPSCTWSEANLTGAMPSLNYVSTGSGNFSCSQVYLQFDWVKADTISGQARRTDLYQAIDDPVGSHDADNGFLMALATYYGTADSVVVFELSDPDSFAGIVIDTIFLIYTGKSESALGAIWPGIQIGGVNYYTETCAWGFGATWATRTTCRWTQNPATSQAFTINDLRNLRVVLKQGKSYSAKITSAYISVAYHIVSEGGNKLLLKHQQRGCLNEENLIRIFG